MFRAKLRMISKPDLLSIYEQIERFNPVYFEIADIFDHTGNLLNFFILRECDHLTDEG